MEYACLDFTSDVGSVDERNSGKGNGEDGAEEHDEDDACVGMSFGSVGSGGEGIGQDKATFYTMQNLQAVNSLASSKTYDVLPDGKRSPRPDVVRLVSKWYSCDLQDPGQSPLPYMITGEKRLFPSWAH